MTKVLVAGIFDIFHMGHLYFFKQAKKFGNELIVIIASDEIAKQNGKRPVHNQNERAEIVKNLKIVNKVVFGDKKDIIKTIKKIKPNILCIGYDQKLPEKIEEYCKKNEILIKKIEKKYNEKNCKSSIIKQRILKEV